MKRRPWDIISVSGNKKKYKKKKIEKLYNVQVSATESLLLLLVSQVCGLQYFYNLPATFRSCSRCFLLFISSTFLFHLGQLNALVVNVKWELLLLALFFSIFFCNFNSVYFSGINKDSCGVGRHAELIHDVNKPFQIGFNSLLQYFFLSFSYPALKSPPYIFIIMELILFC